MMETKSENNKLLEEFLGYIRVYFDSDLNEIALILDKIESLGYNTFVVCDNNSAIPERKHQCIIHDKIHATDPYISVWGRTRIEAIYIACVDFVKWYNLWKK